MIYQIVTKYKILEWTINVFFGSLEEKLKKPKPIDKNTHRDRIMRLVAKIIHDNHIKELKSNHKVSKHKKSNDI